LDHINFAGTVGRAIPMGNRKNYQVDRIATMKYQVDRVATAENIWWSYTCILVLLQSREVEVEGRTKKLNM
jgi:hypothetical protein